MDGRKKITKNFASLLLEQDRLACALQRVVVFTLKLLLTLSSVIFEFVNDNIYRHSRRQYISTLSTTSIDILKASYGHISH